MHFLVFLTLCVFLAVDNCHAETKSEHDLRKAIFEGYDKLVRPIRNAANSIPATVSLIPVAVKDVDVSDKIVKLDTWLVMKWQDDYLTWNPSEYSGLESLRLPESEVWKPDISVFSGTPDTNMFPSSHSQVVIYANGTTYWVPPFTVKSRCPPTDDQVTEDTFKCTVSLGSWTYDVTLLDLHEDLYNLEEELSEAYEDVHEKWSLESTTLRRVLKKFSCCEESYPIVKVDLLFKKKAGHR